MSQATGSKLGTDSELRIKRYFTTEGVHPFDEIEWDRRDAVIQNYRTGEVAFEQRGVEVPKSWSQNATNIASQKYFRGSLGTPQREDSVKQMIGRVVDRYHEEGMARGYFADEAEADIFRAELTHLLVTQKAAFNSPVWFNVGWRPKGEEQVSACQPYDALVSTPEGLVPIGQLVSEDAVGQKVYDAEGLTRIVAVKANGVRDVLRIHTKAGHTLDVTPDHLVWKRSGEKSGRFVPAGELVLGDQLEWHRRGSFGDGEINLEEIREAALAGWLQSDGFVGQYKGTNKSLTIEAMTVNDAELDWVIGAIDAVFPDVHRHERRVPTQDPRLDCRRTCLYGWDLKDFVDKWSLRDRGVDMRVPEDLFTAPLPVVAAYLKSIFQAEGSISIRERSAQVCVDMISEELIRGIQRLLLRFGIFSRVGFKPDQRVDRKGCWSVRIQNLGDRATFESEIGFVDPVKSAKLEQSLEMFGLASRPTKTLEIDRVEPLGSMEVYDIQTESGEYLSNNLRVHNCFILSVEDEMSSILNWYVEEGLIFKHGSGSGINLSKIRSSKERLRSGGTASGPVSFMRGADASAGTIKSGGATRRAAKMVVLNVDHPDIKDFIWCKAHEEEKARALREAGFDMDLDGKDSHSIQYQNANNSVRVTDEFMNSVIEDRDWHLNAVTTGESLETLKARELFREIAQAAWECADPGIQYDTTINDWHTASNTGRINASNPCSEYVHLDDSSCNLASLNLMKFVDEDDVFDIDGYKHAVEVMFLAQEISVGFASYPTEKIRDTSLRFRQLGQGYANLGALLMSQGLPYDSEEGRTWAGAITAIMTGHCYATSAKIAKRVGPFSAYQENREPMLRVMRKHRDAAYEIADKLAPDSLVNAARQVWDEAVSLGESNGYRNAQATVLAPTGCLVGGTLVPTERGLVRLGSLGDVDGEQWQDLDILVNTDEGPRTARKFYVNGLESVVNVETERGYRIQGTPKHRIKVRAEDGQHVWKRLAEIMPGDMVPLVVRGLIGESQAIKLPIAPSSLMVPERVTPQLAELIGYFMRDDSVWSENGLSFGVPEGDFETENRLHYLSKVVFEIEARAGDDGGAWVVVIASSDVANWWRAAGFLAYEKKCIPDVLLQSNNPEIYDAFLEGARRKDIPSSRWVTKHEELAQEIQQLWLALGFASFKHQDDGAWIVSVPEFLDRDTTVMYERVQSAQLGDEQLTYDLSVPDNVTYLANGFVSHNTIGLLMDCDTTGIEPDLALKKTKKLVGGGTMSIVNHTVPRALKKLGYDPQQIAEIVAYIDDNSHVVGAPHLRQDHLPVFDTAMGERSINYMGHIRMMGAAQPFLSGAISKTVNLPENVSVEDVEQAYIEGWRSGLKALAIYRDNCKVGQPLSSTKKEVAKVAGVTELPQPVRRRLPKKRSGKTMKFRVADTEGYITTGEYDDGSIGELFLKVAKQGSTLAGIMDAFAISISMGLQYGVPLSAYVKQFVGTRFEPSGMTDDADFRLATSILDYVFRVLALEYLNDSERHALNIRTSGERQNEIESKLDPAATQTEITKTTNGSGNGHDKDEGVIMLGPVTGAQSAQAGSLPFCGTCGVQMNPAGSCFACPSCGSTSGCS